MVDTQREAVEVVVVTRNSAGHIGPCIDSIVAQGGRPIVVDNGSTDRTLDIVRSRCSSAGIIATDENLGYAKAINRGFKETSGEFVILSNPDVIYLDDSIHKLVEFLRQNPQIGIAGPQQMFPDRSWQRSYGDLPGIWCGVKDAVGITTLRNRIRRMLWPTRLDRQPKDVPFVDGAVLAVRRSLFEAIGGFDEAFRFYSDESDLCARMKKAGWRNVFFPSAEVIHIRGADSAKVDRSDRFVRLTVYSQSLLAQKHLPRWEAQLYAKLQMCHYARLSLMARTLRFFVPRDASLDYKLWVFSTFTKVWKEAVTVGQPVPTLDNGRPDQCKP